VGGQRHASAALPPGKRLVPIVQEAGWAPGPVWTGAEISPPQFLFFGILFYSVLHPYVFPGVDCPAFCLFSLLITHKKNARRRDFLFLFYRSLIGTRWFKYDRDYLCVNNSQFVPVIFEPPCTLTVLVFFFGLLSWLLLFVLTVQHTIQTSITPARFEFAISVSELPQTLAIELSATGIGYSIPRPFSP
jgi:hypothetical protein